LVGLLQIGCTQSGVRMTEAKASYVEQDRRKFFQITITVSQDEKTREATAFLEPWRTTEGSLKIDLSRNVNDSGPLALQFAMEMAADPRVINDLFNKLDKSRTRDYWIASVIQQTNCTLHMADFSEIYRQSVGKSTTFSSDGDVFSDAKGYVEALLQGGLLSMSRNVPESGKKAYAACVKVIEGIDKVDVVGPLCVTFTAPGLDIMGFLPPAAMLFEIGL